MSLDDDPLHRVSKFWHAQYPDLFVVTHHGFPVCLYVKQTGKWYCAPSSGLMPIKYHPKGVRVLVTDPDLLRIYRQGLVGLATLRVLGRC